MGKLSVWERLLMRLQSVANNQHNGGCDGVAIITIQLFIKDGEPIGWSRPHRLPLEPKTVDVDILMNVLGEKL